MPGAGPYYSYAQLEQLWIQNGGAASLAPIAAAIAMAESGGGAGSTNPTDNGGRQTSWGLWQISNGTHNQPVPNILDPNVNAGAAVGKYNGAHGWSPWGTYSSGAYKRYLQYNVPPSSAGVPAGGPGSSIGGAVIGAAGAGVGGPVGGSTVDVSATSGGSSGSSASGTASTCLIGYNGVFGTSVGSFCVLSKVEMRALIGGIFMVAGAAVALAGVFLIVRGSIPNPVTQPTVNVNVNVPKEKPAKPEPKPKAEPQTATGTRVRPGRPSPHVVTMLTKPRTLALPGGKS